MELGLTWTITFQLSPVLLMRSDPPVQDLGENSSRQPPRILKGLGHAILGNFSTDQIVIELT